MISEVSTTNLSAEDLQAGAAYLVTAFPDKCQVIAKQRSNEIMWAMAKLAQIKHQEENGISAGYWQKFFRDRIGSRQRNRLGVASD